MSDKRWNELNVRKAETWKSNLCNYQRDLPTHLGRRCDKFNSSCLFRQFFFFYSWRILRSYTGNLLTTYVTYSTRRSNASVATPKTGGVSSCVLLYHSLHQTMHFRGAGSFTPSDTGFDNSQMRENFGFPITREHVSYKAELVWHTSDNTYLNLLGEGKYQSIGMKEIRRVLEWYSAARSTFQPRPRSPATDMSWYYVIPS